MRAGPPTADGDPYAGPLVAAVDESSPAAGGAIFYVVAAAATFDIDAATKASRSVVEQRTRPFHWAKEGPTARHAMLEVIVDVCAAVNIGWETTGRKGQVTARARLLTNVAAWAQTEGVDHLVIESGDADGNQRDRSVLGAHARDHGPLRFTYDHRSKAEPILWIPDAIAGATSEHLTGVSSEYYAALVAAGLVSWH